jgi:hypothetical protein
MAGVYDAVKSFSDGFLAKGQSVIDSLFPPEKRAEVLAKLQAFAVNNPKLSVSSDQTKRPSQLQYLT